MRFSFATALLLAAVASPLCAAAPMDPVGAAAAASDAPEPIRRNIPAALKHAWTSVSGAVKTGAVKAKNYVAAHPRIAAGVVGVGASAYVAHKYLPPHFFRRPRPIKIERCEISFRPGCVPAPSELDHAAKGAPALPPHDKGTFPGGPAADYGDAAPRWKPAVGEPASPVERPAGGGGYGGDRVAHPAGHGTPLNAVPIPLAFENFRDTDPFSSDDVPAAALAVAYARGAKDVAEALKYNKDIGSVTTTTVTGQGPFEVEFIKEKPVETEVQKKD